MITTASVISVTFGLLTFLVLKEFDVNAFSHGLWTATIAEVAYFSTIAIFIYKD